MLGIHEGFYIAAGHVSSKAEGSFTHSIGPIEPVSAPTWSERILENAGATRAIREWRDSAARRAQYRYSSALNGPFWGTLR